MQIVIPPRFGGSLRRRRKWWATLESNQACVSARELQSPATPYYAFSGKVEIVEALGEVTQLYFAEPKEDLSPVIAKLPGIHTDLRGKVINMTTDPGKVHLFSKGKSLLYR